MKTKVRVSVMIRAQTKYYRRDLESDLKKFKYSKKPITNENC